MKCSLLEFMEQGCLGPIALGANRTTVKECFGAPPNRSAEAKTPDSAVIWKYGDVEFYFDRDQLWMIFMEDFDVPCGEGDLELSAGPFYGGMPLVDAIQVLHTEKITYERMLAVSGLSLLTTANVMLVFDENNQDLTGAGLRCIRTNR